jgi:hypothetical protein
MPWLPEALDDIEELFGEDPWPYGVEANREDAGGAGTEFGGSEL